MDVAQALILGMQTWGMIGALVALVFLTIGIDRIDEDARGAYVFRPLLIPAVLLIWPIVLWRWWQVETERAGWAARYRPVRAFYGLTVIAMSVGIVVIVITGLSIRQTWPADVAPVQLTEGASQ